MSRGTSQGSVSNCVSKLPARSTSWAVVPLLQVLWLPPSAQVVRSGASSPSKHWSPSSATGTSMVPRWTSSSPTTSAIQSGSSQTVTVAVVVAVAVVAVAVVAVVVACNQQQASLNSKQASSCSNVDCSKQSSLFIRKNCESKMNESHV